MGSEIDSADGNEAGHGEYNQPPSPPQVRGNESRNSESDDHVAGWEAETLCRDIRAEYSV